VTIDPHPRDGMRFIATCGEKNMTLIASSDGINFKEAVSNLTPFTCDTANQILWDPDIGRYVAYLRGFGGTSYHAPLWELEFYLFDNYAEKPLVLGEDLRRTERRHIR